jgi:5-methylcytosine-specific restriction endonuclease McrA
MSRREFTKKTQREAFTRSGFKCEATGAMYGLEPGNRCNADLAKGVEFDHIVLDANSKDNSLANCAAVCIPCHKHKTAKHDIPMAAKTVRMQDKARGIKLKPAKTLRGAGFAKPDKSDRGVPNKGMPPLPRPQLYREESP